MDAQKDPNTGLPLLLLGGMQDRVPAGAALFSLEGSFIGLVRDGGAAPVVVPAETLRLAAERAKPLPMRPHATLGLDVEALNGSLARATRADRGVVVVDVAAAGPADGHLQSGDVIQAVDGSPVSTVAGYREIARSRAPGAAVTITGVRRGEPLEVTLTAADASAPAPPAGGPGFVGRSVPGVGIEVVTVGPGGAAAVAGLVRGDLIVRVDGELPRDAAAVARRFRSAPSGGSVLITIQRGERYRVLALEKP
jgi:S1-C subfamily serine protease